MSRQQYTFYLRNLCQSVHKVVYLRYTLKAEDSSILSKVYKHFSYAL
jgi:hypothetical protein